MTFETLEWVYGFSGGLEMIDQRKLPGKFEKLYCKTIEQVWDAIKTLAVRGAPAIGVAAAYGLCVESQALPLNESLEYAIEHLEKNAAYLATSRPTAVNLFWALDRMVSFSKKFVVDNPEADIEAFIRVLLDEAHAICREDKAMCKAIGVNGEQFITENTGILTHCNAGALATAGQGTALSPMYEAHSLGREFKVYADETRPLLQGGRLTAWELTQSGIDVTVICDNMACTVMKQGKISAVIVGADRIAANGDAANKIGTCGVSILAKEYGIPFYVAAPSSTFDLNIKTGDEIPIEERDATEVTSFGGTNVAPKGVKVFNPAFDVTEAKYITAIITEKGVVEYPDTEKIAAHLSNG